MKIVRVVCAPGRTGFFFDDQLAIKGGAVADGESYRGKAVTPGFTAVRQAGECISVMLVLDDGQVAYGDCAAVQYSGAGGRDPLFLAKDFIPVIEEYVLPKLVGRQITSFREMADEIEHMEINGSRLHTAIRYGVSQALLDAVAKSRKKLMCEIIAEEYGTKVRTSPVHIFAQTGDHRYDNADKAILKGAEVLPHGLINNIETKLGVKGEILLEYVRWLSKRIIDLRIDDSYSPIIHIDVYGLIGQLFGNENYGAMIDYFAELVGAADPFKLRIEGPMDVGNREGQMQALSTITKIVDDHRLNLEIVADEWCNTLEDVKYFADNKAGHMLQIKTPDLGGIGNTVEAVLYCKEKGVGAYQGGTCNETDRSGHVCVHIAMATSPDQILAKPGMGVDEGYLTVYNEMSRIIALLKVEGK